MKVLNFFNHQSTSTAVKIFQKAPIMTSSGCGGGGRLLARKESILLVHILFHVLFHTHPRSYPRTCPRSRPHICPRSRPRTRRCNHIRQCTPTHTRQCTHAGALPKRPRV
jgi:hypothetical protein